MKLIKPIFQGKLTATLATGGCGACKNSCQSACKTSCTVGNQVCQKTLSRVISHGSKLKD